MTEVKISDNWSYREIENLVEFYKSNKKFSKLVRNKLFKVTTPQGTDVKFKVTYIKNDGNLKVNVKICGQISTRWSYYGDVNKLTKGKHYGFRSARARNDKIRHEIERTVCRYFAMFGVTDFYVSVGTINICDEL